MLIALSVRTAFIPDNSDHGGAWISLALLENQTLAHGRLPRPEVASQSIVDYNDLRRRRVSRRECPAGKNPNSHGCKIIWSHSRDRRHFLEWGQTSWGGK